MHTVSQMVMEAQSDSPYYSYTARSLTVIHTYKESYAPLQSKPVDVEQIFNLPAHRTLYYRDTNKFKPQKMVDEGQLLSLYSCSTC